MQELLKVKRRPGQPSFKPTPAQRTTVKLLVASGISEPVIAEQVGCCQNTLRKHFAHELLFGHGEMMSENLARLRKAADKGNVAAIKYLDEKFRVVSARTSFIVPPPARKGKKEEARLSAITAGSDSGWGDDLSPPADALPN